MKLFARIVATVLTCGTLLSAQALVVGITEGVTYRATDAEIEARFEAIAKVLSTATRQPVKIQIISSYNGLRETLKKDQVDLAFIHPSHIAFEAIKSGNYRAVAWTSGYTEYKVSLMCKEPQPIQNWAAIAGKAFVTPDPDSITAVMTRAMLREHNLQPTDVKLQTTRYQDAVPFYVEHGFAAYGATASSSVIKAWKDKGGKTCAESRPMPIKQWIAASKLDPSLSNALRDALLNLEQTETGKRALLASGYKGFVPPSPEQEKRLIFWLGL
jgi:ABC-type phosphate/phosphonate transport system substrate-binding protein